MAEEKDGTVIYQHPQSKLLSKMASLVRLKTPVPAVPTDPVAVLDRKLDQDDRRLKQDNKRWRSVIYLTVTICLIIFCLVLAQVISSVTSSSGQLPNIDVAEKTRSSASLDSPRHEPLVAGMSSANPQTTAGEPQAKEMPGGKEGGTPKEIVINPGESGEIFVTTPSGSPKDDYVLTIAETAQGENYDMSVRKEGEGSEETAAAVEKALEEAVHQAEQQREQQAVQQAVLQAEAQAVRQTVEEEVVREIHLGLHEGDALRPQGRSGYVAYIPVPLGGEEKKAKTTTTTSTTTRRPQRPLVQHRPFFVPVMFQERLAPPPVLRPPLQRVPSRVMRPPPPTIRQPLYPSTRPALLRPPPLSPSLTNQGPSLPPATNERQPFQGHPLTHQRRPVQGHSPRPQLALLLQRPGVALPQSFNLQQETNLHRDPRPIGQLPLNSNSPFGSRMGPLLRDMRQLISTVSPLIMMEPTLPSNVSRDRLLGLRGPFRPLRPVVRRPVVPQTRGFPSRPPPAGLRPGPFRPPISVAPPHQPANQRVFAPRPTNRRPFRPRPVPPPANQRVFQQRDFVPPRPVAPPRPPLTSENPSRRFFNQPSQTVTLVGNPQYNYPSTATGIQDILSYIQGDYRPPHNGHGAYNRLNGNSGSSNRFSSSDNRYNSNNGGGGFGSTGSPSGGGRRQDGPIYPPGYEGQRFSLGSQQHPFRLMLDVYPMEDSDRYGGPDARAFGLQPLMARSGRLGSPVLRQRAFEGAIHQERPVIRPMIREGPLTRAMRMDPFLAQSSRFEPLLAFMRRRLTPTIRPFPMESSMVMTPRYLQRGHAAFVRPQVSKLVYHEYQNALPGSHHPQMARAMNHRRLNKSNYFNQALVASPIFQRFPPPQIPTVSKVVFHQYPNGPHGLAEKTDSIESRMLNQINHANQPLVGRPIFRQFHTMQRPPVSKVVFHEYPDRPQTRGQVDRSNPTQPRMMHQVNHINQPLISNPIFQQSPSLQNPTISKVAFHDYPNTRPEPQRIHGRPHPAELLMLNQVSPMRPNFSLIQPRVIRPTISKIVFHEYPSSTPLSEQIQAQVTQTEGRAQGQAQPHDLAEAQVQAQAKAKAQTQAQGQVQAAREAQAQVAQARVRAHVQAQAQAQAQAKESQAAQVQAAQIQAAQAQAHVLAQVETQSLAQAEVQAQKQTKAQSVAQGDAQTQAQAKAQTLTEAEARDPAHAQVQTEARVHTEAQDQH